MSGKDNRSSTKRREPLICSGAGPRAPYVASQEPPPVDSTVVFRNILAIIKGMSDSG